MKGPLKRISLSKIASLQIPNFIKRCYMKWASNVEEVSSGSGTKATH